MLVLRTSSASPFGRKVKIAAAVAGLSDRIEVVVADTGDAADPLRTQNPLGKIPTLVLEDGESLFDSRVIVEYFHELAPGAGLFPAGPARFAVLRQQALADGLMDAALLQVYEGRYRPAGMRVQAWVDYQHGKVRRALGYANERYATPGAAPVSASPDVGEIALACALGYLDFRFSGEWRGEFPALERWLEEFAGRTEAFEGTSPGG